MVAFTWGFAGLRRIVLISALALGCSSGDDKSAEPAAKTEQASPAEPTPGLPQFRRFASAGEAVQAVLDERKPRVIGFGEFHELAGARARSALARFHDSVRPVLVGRTSDLIVEIWARDTCGAKSESVNRNVQQMTQRPPATENQIVTLLTATKAAGVQNHVLKLSCADYDSILAESGEVDYEKLLLLVTDKLYAKADEVLTAREGKHPASAGRNLVVLYGGALHNDLRPYESTRDLTYAPRLAERAGGDYVEIDLYVPEYVTGDDLLQTESWYPLLEQASADGVLLVPRSESSYILIMKKGLERPAPAEPRKPTAPTAPTAPK